MTRVLVMQLFEALIHAVPSDQEDEQAEAIAAITEARAYLATEPSGERAELIAELRERHGKRFVVSPSMFSRAADMLEADAQQATTPMPNGYVLVPLEPTESMIAAATAEGGQEDQKRSIET